MQCGFALVTLPLNEGKKFLLVESAQLGSVFETTTQSNGLTKYVVKLLVCLIESLIELKLFDDVFDSIRQVLAIQIKISPRQQSTQ